MGGQQWNAYLTEELKTLLRFTYLVSQVVFPSSIKQVDVFQSQFVDVTSPFIAQFNSPMDKIQRQVLILIL